LSRSLWAARRQRATQLLRDAGHAREILLFYADLTEVQQRVAERVPAREWLDPMGSGSEPPLLRVEQIPAEALLLLFDDFLVDLQSVGTAVITAGSRALLEAGPAVRRSALVEAAGFHARAFLEPVLTTLVTANASEDHAIGSAYCGGCGSLPVVGVLQDLPDALGARSLVCSLCASERRVDRLRCASCGETSPESLRLHTPGSVPWVRIEECLACRRYLKTIDLRRRGDAIPVVDELATVELDLWARERGLSKIQLNVLEL